MGKTFLLSTVLTWGVLILLIPAQGAKSDDPTRTTEYGEIRGTHINIKRFDKGVNVFLGIPFARPPTGALRFSPPQPPEPWSEVREATSYPSMCLQDITNLESLRKFLNINFSITATSEDCLYLNIYVPDHAKEGARLPVMVWVHGGCLLSGSASMYDGSKLSASQNIVVVTIQYRLGLLGFFSTGDEHASGNWGYLDQVAALKWVQENIAHFGGDPGHVTVFEESIGGMRVSSYVLYPISKTLFYRQTMESRVVIHPGLTSFSSESITSHIANISACESYSSAAIVECLRNKTEREILAISKQFVIIPGMVNGQFFPKHSADLLTSAKFHHLPSIIGTNNYDWIIPVRLGISQFKEEITRENIREMLLSPLIKSMNPEDVNIFIDKYLGNTEDPKELRLRLQEMMGNLIFFMPSFRVARYQQSPSSQVYFYAFHHRLSMLKGTEPDYIEVNLADELRFIFGAQFLHRATKEENLIGEKIMVYWANFVKNGPALLADLQPE
ncbi:pyrethroid hydrolase Ces2e-like isoform X1 [Sarcophilus harrisii]|uniref:Carboxylesterase type B domain-containing protein n=1 Tax=Sarcophilus harrisii TaxID=9305 RepID=G3VZX8_SARHA|nr:pyrethroid hydrolase Ces2e-like isoform X1 [Sarcophilus harrisii]